MPGYPTLPGGRQFRQAFWSKRSNVAILTITADFYPASVQLRPLDYLALTPLSHFVLSGLEKSVIQLSAMSIVVR